ncbi:MAG: molybdopterin cofactor-binding domain-containing protein, partial [Jiangellaceae bacterium]
MTLVRGQAGATALPKHLVANPVLSRWITVRGDGIVEVRVGKVELGQGILTALAQLAADELDLGLDQVRMQPARTGEGPDEGLTAGSMSVSDSGSALRLACANVRGLFMAEAARRWQVDIGRIVVERGTIRTVDASRVTTYAELSGSVDLDVDADPNVTIKAVHELRAVGTSAARLDLPDKIAGRPRYISDLRLPGQMFGRVVRPPSPGAQLLSVDHAALGPASVQVVRDGSFLGVIGDDEAEVVRAVERLRAASTWRESALLPDENDLVGFLKVGPHE